MRSCMLITTSERVGDSKTGKTLQLFKGHTAPVTSLAFCDKKFGSGKKDILITGSWDQARLFLFANGEIVLANCVIYSR